VNGYEERYEKNDLPVTYVSWFQCMRFVNAANNVRENILPDAYKDYKFALPTEAQWEYACRADKDKCDFSYGKERKDEKGEEIFASKLEGYAVYKYPQDTTKSAADIIPRPTSPAEIGLKKSRKGNNWLIYDMHGNVREWCADRYGEYAPEYGKETGTPKMRKDPTGSRDGRYRVLRGGGYNSDDEHCRSASRDNQLPELSKDDIGFRVVLVHKNSPFWIAFEKLHVKNLDKEEKLADERMKANMGQSE
jgi:formylglycine-generating enzyme required for sulfatase activity